MRTHLRLLVLFAGFFSPSVLQAANLQVPATYARITDALAASNDGDTVSVAAGLYSPSANGETIPLVVSKNVSLLGAGYATTTIDAEMLGSVIRITALGDVQVSGFTITGGFSFNGGGVWASSGTAQIDNNLIWANACLSEGNGIFLNGGTNHWVHHNVIWESYDRDLVDPGDPHGIQINGVFATVEHNLVGRGDSNSLFITGSEPVIRNNIFFENGIPGVRGRGICNFGGPNTVIAHNLFFGNEIAPILTNTLSGFQDLSSAAANALSGGDGIYGNLDADPEFVDPNNHDWTLMSTSAAIDLGDPGSPLDPDGTTADAGPFYFDQSTSSVPDGRGLVPQLFARPNPFQTQTRLAFSIPAGEIGAVFVIDLQGRHVAQLEAAAAGTTEATAVWDGRNQSGTHVAGGVYFVRVLRTNGSSLETKLVLVDR